jgi:hypothetical protein
MYCWGRERREEANGWEGGLGANQFVWSRGAKGAGDGSTIPVGGRKGRGGEAGPFISALLVVIP